MLQKSRLGLILKKIFKKLSKYFQKEEILGKIVMLHCQGLSLEAFSMQSSTGIFSDSSHPGNSQKRPTR
jgi:hypothetical protein